MIIVEKTVKRSPEDSKPDRQVIGPPKKSILERLQGVNNPYRPERVYYRTLGFGHRRPEIAWFSVKSDLLAVGSF